MKGLNRKVKGRDMRIIFGKATEFREFMTLASKNLDEMPIVVDESGISIRSLSEDKTTMIILKIPAELFDEIELDQRTAFLVRSADLNKVLKRAVRGDSLELSIEGSELNVEFKNEKQMVKRSFKIPITLTEPEEIGEPKVDMQVEASLATKDLKEIAEDLKRVGGDFRILFEQNELKFLAESSGRSYIAVLKEGAPLLSLSSKVEKAESKYSVDLFYSVVRGLTSEGVVSLIFGEQLPLKLSSEISKLGSLVYWIAPTA